MAQALAPTIGDEMNKGMTKEDVQKVVDAPVQQFLSAEVPVVARGLMHIPFTIVETAEHPGTLPRDAPCARVRFRALRGKPQRSVLVA